MTKDNKCKIKCSDCGKEDYETWFENAPENTSENRVFLQHGTSFSKCSQCDEMFCQDCTSEHASFEAWG